MAGRQKFRVYADTSVFGGVFDEEFAEASETFFDQIRAGRFTLVLSATSLRELNEAPEQVQSVLASVPPEHLEMLPDDEEVTVLRDAYLAAGIVGPASQADAEHVAAASVAGVDMIVSWNFRHIVHFDRIRGYHGINVILGYNLVGIFSPREVIEP